MTRYLTNHVLNEASSQDRRDSDRRRRDWQRNDRRQSWPWVVDINDRRSGFDRRWEERRARGSQGTGSVPAL